jgi:hypothetical protein
LTKYLIQLSTINTQYPKGAHIWKLSVGYSTLDISKTQSNIFFLHGFPCFNHRGRREDTESRKGSLPTQMFLLD